MVTYGKVNLFAKIFDEKHSSEELVILQSSHPKVKLTTLAFRPREIKTLMLDLYPYIGSGPDGIFDWREQSRSTSNRNVILFEVGLFFDFCSQFLILTLCFYSVMTIFSEIMKDHPFKSFTDLSDPRSKFKVSKNVNSYRGP